MDFFHSFLIDFFLWILGWIVLSFGTRRKRNEKGGKHQFPQLCTNPANELDVERSNVALKRSNVRIHVRLGQKAETSNVRTLSLNVWMFESPCPEPKTWGTERSNSCFGCSNVQCTLTLMTLVQLIWLYIFLENRGIVYGTLFGLIALIIYLDFT